MLFTPTLLVAGGATVALACLDKTLDSYGFHALGTALRIALPLAALLAGVYFIETNALLGWLR
ncbi:hypothetical protein PZE06_12070 [Robertmurraya sp. DFI.2.37]|uniref:hypothetical protein n=1 Tax=Robertmurraya sp. DFI.2.37 TaxID=3031819 RepID=UPI001243BA85|nr:hypothetical protein [Robertmurraya sp. DFI.2.37]MDF1507177.1 hypothetical protein [Robertmurraya sp. DFI.2.37]MDF1508908.1 hypothetical protein [Robertmurraya sp. DFI.2.37]